MADVAYSEEQMAAIEGLVNGAKMGMMRQTMGGYAGTGKSTVLKAVYARLPGFIPCAFTGKAAYNLRTKGMPAQTIHSTIYRPIKTPDGVLHFELKSRGDLLNEGIRGFLADESSMVSDLLDEDLRGFNLPIIYVGDHGQLEPIGSNPNIMLSPDYVLEKVHRNAGDIARFAEWIRLGNDPAHFKCEDGKVTYIKPSHGYKITSKVLLGANQIICAYNKTRVQRNTQIRNLLNKSGDAQVGDRVMCLKNKREAGLFNGMQGVITYIDHRRRVLDFQSETGLHKDVEFLPGVFNAEKLDEGQQSDPRIAFFYAHAGTCHKCQGSEWSKVLVIEQVCKNWDHVRWAYTAASRAKDELVWFGARRHIQERTVSDNPYDEIP